MAEPHRAAARLPSCLIGAALLAACSGSTASPPPGPTLTSASPANGATGVLPGAALQLTFSEAIDPASAAVGSVTLTGPIGAVAGTVSTSGRVVTFTPVAPLAWETGYRLSAGTTLKSAAGVALGGAVSAAFTTRALSWKAGAPFPATLAGNEQSPVVAFSASGDAIAVWMQNDLVKGALFTTITASRYAASTGHWSAPRSIQGTTTDHTQSPQIAVAPGGDAIVVWEQGPASWQYPNVWSARYDAATDGWEPPAPVFAKPTGVQTGPLVAVDAAGDGVVVWTEGIGSSSATVVAARRTPVGAWSTPQPLPSGAGPAFGPAVAVDLAGNATALWHQQVSPGVVQIRASRLAAGAGSWSAPVPVQAGAAADSSRFAVVAAGPAGDAVAAWIQTEGGTDHLVSTRASAGTWAAPVDVATVGGSLDTPSLGVDPAGNVLALWVEYGTTNAMLHAARLPHGATAWGAAATITQTYPQNPLLGVDSAGNALAAWWDLGTPPQLVIGARFNAATLTWSAPLVLQTGTDQSQSPALAVSGDGSAVAMWPQGAGTLLQVAWLSSP